MSISDFLVGAIVGGACCGALSFYICKKKFDDDLAFEIDMCRKNYNCKNESEKIPEDDEPYTGLLGKYSASAFDAIPALYTPTSNLVETNNPIPNKEIHKDSIFVIHPDEFGEEYETSNWSYYNDDVFVDDLDHRIEEDMAISCIGIQAVDSFKKGRKEPMYIRNQSLKLDIEIVYDPEPYSDSHAM